MTATFNRLWDSRYRVLVLGALAVALMAALPNFIDDYYVFLGCEVMIYAIAGLGLTVLMGWTGQIALAHAGFFAIGAYGTAILSADGFPWPVALVLAGLCATASGILVGFPAVRLRGFYLAIATLAFGELVQRLLILFASVTKGNLGFPVDLIDVGIGTTLTLWYVSLVILVIGVVALSQVGRTRLGRMLRAVRDIEVATGALGISASRYKLLAFAISAFIGGIAGGLYGQLVTFLTPPIFSLDLLIVFLIVVYLGGVLRLAGPIVGAVFVVLIVEQLQDLGSWQRLVFGLILVAIIRFMPGGLVSLPSLLRRRQRGSNSTGGGGLLAEPAPVRVVDAIPGGTP